MPADHEPIGLLPALLIRVDRWLRTHPFVIGLFTVGSVAAIGVGEIWNHSNAAIALTYALPLAACGYGVGLIAGVVTAGAVSILWLLDALKHGLPEHEATFVFGVRLFSNMVIVGMGGLAAAAARARDGYLDGQRQLGQFRADLVSAFSHDLRSPLTAIVGYAEILQHDARDPETQEIVDRILDNTRRVDKLIGDMLTAGQGDGPAPLQVSVFAPEALVAELRAEFEQAERRRSVALLWQVEPQTPPLQTDRAKLASLVRNLVTNALKFTSEGSVRVRIEYDPDLGVHRIEVKDTGCGIPADAIPHLFDRFYRAQETQRIDGFGLGLFIVKRFADLLGGTVAVQSEIDRGSCFTVTVPALNAECAALNVKREA
jgi:signal transduction histidine kinase